MVSPLRSYEDFFVGGKVAVLHDEVYTTSNGFGRIFTVKLPNQQIDQVHFVCPPHRKEEDGTHWSFFVESTGRYYAAPPTFADLGDAEFPRRFRHDYLVPPQEHSAVAKFLELGWHCLAVRTLDERTSTPDANVINLNSHIAPSSAFYMCRSWILVHPRNQLLLELSLTVSSMKLSRNETAALPLSYHWLWGAVRNDLSTHSVGLLPNYALLPYIEEHAHTSFFLPPDAAFAQLFDALPARPLPFERLCSYQMDNYYIFPGNSLGAPLLRRLRRLCKKYADKI